jgi:hypothetical protein
MFTWCVRHVVVYESETMPAVQDNIPKHEPTKSLAARFRRPRQQCAVHDTAAREAHGADALGVRSGDLEVDAVHDQVRHNDSPKVWLGDLGGPVVEDPAAPRSTQPAARGTTSVALCPCCSRSPLTDRC